MSLLAAALAESRRHFFFELRNLVLLFFYSLHDFMMGQKDMKATACVQGFFSEMSEIGAARADGAGGDRSRAPGGGDGSGGPVTKASPAARSERGGGALQQQQRVGPGRRAGCPEGEDSPNHEHRSRTTYPGLWPGGGEGFRKFPPWLFRLRLVVFTATWRSFGIWQGFRGGIGCQPP